MCIWADPCLLTNSAKSEMKGQHRKRSEKTWRETILSQKYGYKIRGRRWGMHKWSKEWWRQRQRTRKRLVPQGLLSLSLYWNNEISGIPDSWEQRGNLQQRRLTLSGGGSDQGIFKQNKIHRTWWDAPRSAEGLVSVFAEPLAIFFERS